MDFQQSNEATETQESKLNIYNVILSYVVEMNEHRSVLYTSSQNIGVTPAPYREFIQAFYKLFTLTRSMLPEDLQVKIKQYFASNPKKTDAQAKMGIELSLEMQKELENQRMITLYEETIVPPFVEISEEEEAKFIPPFVKKPILKKAI